jgi:hypothetical protein
VCRGELFSGGEFPFSFLTAFNNATMLNAFPLEVMGGLTIPV